MSRLDASSEPSMEDILASIRRIIAEQPGDARPPTPSGAGPLATNGSSGMQALRRNDPFASMRSSTASPTAKPSESPKPTHGFMARNTEKPSPAAEPAPQAIDQRAETRADASASATPQTAADLLAGFKAATSKLSGGDPQEQQAKSDVVERGASPASATESVGSERASSDTPVTPESTPESQSSSSDSNVATAGHAQSSRAGSHTQTPSEDDPFSFDLGPSPFAKTETAGKAENRAESENETKREADLSAEGTRDATRDSQLEAGRSEASRSEDDENAAALSPASEEIAAAPSTETSDDVPTHVVMRDVSDAREGNDAQTSADDVSTSDHTETTSADDVDTEILMRSSDSVDTHASDAEIGAEARTDGDDDDGDDPFADVDAAASAAVAKLNTENDFPASRDTARAVNAERRDGGNDDSTTVTGRVDPSPAESASNYGSVNDVLNQLRGDSHASHDAFARPSEKPARDNGFYGRATSASDAAVKSTSTAKPTDNNADAHADRPYTSRFSAPHFGDSNHAGAPRSDRASQTMYPGRSATTPGYGFVARPGNHPTTRDVMNLNGDEPMRSSRVPFSSQSLPDAVTERIDPPETDNEVEEVHADHLNAIATIVSESNSDDSESRALEVSDPDQRALEDTVADLLRPMLKSWLAENMPKIVERALRREISELSQGRRKPAAE